MQQPGRSVARRIVPIGLACAIATLAPLAASAQTAQKPRPSTSKPTGPKWEVSFHGGFATGSATPDGVSSVPPAGETFTMADGLTPTRAVSSWYFGDGASLLNQVLQLRGISARLDPLHMPDWAAASRQSGFQVGARIARRLKRGVWLEGGLDVGLDPLGFDNKVRDRVENTRADFETAFKALAASAAAIITTSTVTSTADFNPNGRRLIVSGVIQYRGDGPVMRPYLLAGLGAATAFGDPATLTLTGTYRFTPPGQAAIEETDTVQLGYKASGSVVWILGGGMMRDLSRSSAYRVEVRLLSSTTKLSGSLDAEPSRLTASPGGAVVLNGTTPGLQFSSSTIRPTLSGAAIRGFDAFTGEGRAFQWVMSAAYVRRF
jgi:hypothetical protein